MVNVKKKWIALQEITSGQQKQLVCLVLFCHFNDRFLILLELNQQYPSGLA